MVLGDKLGAASDFTSSISHDEKISEVVGTLMAGLSDRQRYVIRRTYGMGSYALTGETTAGEMAEELQVSRQRVAQIKEEAVIIMQRNAKRLGIRVEGLQRMTLRTEGLSAAWARLRPER